MNRGRYILCLLGLVMAFSLNSCGPESTDEFDPIDLIGHWQEGTVHEKYLSDGTGLTWDTSDDISEDEALPFDWSLDGNQLIQEHIMWDSAIVPRILTVTQLNSMQLVYTDGYETHTFHRALGIAP